MVSVTINLEPVTYVLIILASWLERVIMISTLLFGLLVIIGNLLHNAVIFREISTYNLL